MKRVFLTEDLSDLRSRDIVLVRRAAVALARYATNGAKGRGLGDPVHEVVTEGRRTQYERALARGDEWAKRLAPTGGVSTCGDLPHWMFRCLGVRDESLVNRDDDGGSHPWAIGANISRLFGSKCVVQSYPLDARPLEGDVLFLDQHGGHVDVLEEWNERGDMAAPIGFARNAAYGQPYARQRERSIGRSGPKLTLDGIPIVWWFSLELALPLLVESASVPDDFVGGIVDDSPYSEPGVPLDVADTAPPPAA